MPWWTVAEAQDGVISSAQLAANGRSPAATARAARRGELRVITRGVYLVGGAPLTYRARLWAAVLATDGVLACEAAGHLWGMLEDPPSDIHLLIPHGRRLTRCMGGVRVHRRRQRFRVAQTREGLPVVPRRDAVLDLLAELGREPAGRLADRALQQRWLSVGDCRQRLRDHPHQRGNPRIRLLADQLSDGAAAHSERLLHRMLRKAGIRGWQPNYRVWVAGELVATVDVAFPERRLAIEIDGMAHHVDVDRFRRDRRRQNALVAGGWTVLRFTWADLTERPAYVIGVIRQMLG